MKQGESYFKLLVVIQTSVSLYFTHLSCYIGLGNIILHIYFIYSTIDIMWTQPTGLARAKIFG